MKRVGLLEGEALELVHNQAMLMASGAILGITYLPRNVYIEGEQLLYIGIDHDSLHHPGDSQTTTVVLVTTNRSWTTRAYIPNEGEVTIRPKIFLRG